MDKIWKSLKLLNSVPFIKKTIVNQVYIWIWSFWLNFTALKWMKKNSKISQFSSFLLRSMYAIQVKIWKWLKLPNSVPFIKKTLVNHLYIWIWSFWRTFCSFIANEDQLQNEWIWRFLVRSWYAIFIKIRKWLKLLNSVPFIKNTLVNYVYIRSWSCWLTFTVLQSMKTNFNISQFSRFLLWPDYAIQVKI